MKKFLFAMFAVIAFAICIPQKAEARDSYHYVTSTLKANTWATSNGIIEKDATAGRKYTYNVLRVTVPANSYIKIKTKDATIIDIYSELTKRERPEHIAEFGNSTYLVKALAKGTYYIGTSSKTRIKYTTVKFKKSSNYCRSRAKKLARGKIDVFSDRDGFNRWYKIVLTKRKAITIYPENDSDGYTYQNWGLYNSNGIRIHYIGNSDSGYKIPILNKGTYYIYIRDPQSEYSGFSTNGAYDVKSISWE